MTSARVCLFACLAVWGCGSSSGKPDAPGAGDDGGPTHVPGMPGLGAHGLKYFKLQDQTGATTLSSPVMATQATGSVLVASVGRGALADFANINAPPTDNKGNGRYTQLDSTHKYANWPSGTALYARTAARGGDGHVVSTFRGGGDEITLGAVEVLEATRIQDVAWTQLDSQAVLTSASVTTTGPATLVAFWWGDGFPGTPQTATPGNGFHLLDTNAYETDSFVQCAVAYKNVTQAGTYQVTWTSTPQQGAQLWLVAVQ